jgi:NAD(P)-dependent dehydrogenase (short-subunit alcohol dehydrogenase family)
MRAQGHGRIVMNSSVLGFIGLKWRGAYVATKHALEGLTDVLRLEMADTPVKVILIEPGPDHLAHPGELDPAFRALDRLGGLAARGPVPREPVQAPLRIPRAGPVRTCRPRR